jgi:hypothetical protein
MDRPTPNAGGVRAALRRLGPLALFVALPVAVVTTMFVIGLVTGPLALDFDTELYPQAKEILAGHNPWPEAIWPPLAAAVSAPFTILPATGAGVAFGLAGLACTAGALWLVGVRDWRVFGIVGLWPPVLGDIRIGHLTPLLCLLAALLWRYRDHHLRAGLALGVATGVKFFLWPLGLWLAACGRIRAAVVGALVAAGSVLVLAPFIPLDEYIRTLRKVSARFDQDSYSLFGFLTQLDVPDTAARAAALAVGATLLVLTWRRTSFTLAIAAALVLSPIVWFDFYALALVPLAIARPRLSAIWFLPLLTWGLPNSGIDTDPVWGVGRELAVFTVVFLVAARGEPSADREPVRRHRLISSEAIT